MRKIFSKTNINLFINVLNQLLGIGFPVIVQLYTIRHFDIVDLGFFNLLNSYWAIFALGLSFFNFYLLKVFATQKSLLDVKSYLTNATVLMYSFITLPFVIFMIYLYHKYPEIFELTLLTSLPIITAPVSFEIYFQASLKNDYILKRRLIVRFIFIILMFYLAKNESDFIIYVYIFCLSSTAENLINLVFINKYISFKLTNLSVLKEIALKSLGYLPFNLTYNLIPNLSIIVASHFVSINEVTIYSVLVRIVNLATSFITSAVMVLYPVKINSYSNNNQTFFNDKKYLINTLFVSLAVAFGLIIFHKVIFIAFLDNYKINNMLIQFSILTTFIIFHSIYNYIVFNYYFIKNRIMYISLVNILLLMVYFIEIILVKLEIIKFNFSIIFMIPYPIALGFIYLEIKNSKKKII